MHIQHNGSDQKMTKTTKITKNVHKQAKILALLLNKSVQETIEEAIEEKYTNYLSKRKDDEEMEQINQRLWDEKEKEDLY